MLRSYPAAFFLRVNTEYVVDFQELYKLGFPDFALLYVSQAMVQIDTAFEHPRWEESQQCEYGRPFNKLSLCSADVKRYQMTQSVEMQQMRMRSTDSAFLFNYFPTIQPLSVQFSYSYAHSVLRSPKLN